MSFNLDRLPTWAQYLIALVIISPVAGFVVLEATVVVTSGGVTGIDWATELSRGGNAAAATAASGLVGWVTLFITPITRKFGVGKAQ